MNEMWSGVNLVDPNKNYALKYLSLIIQYYILLRKSYNIICNKFIYLHILGRSMFLRTILFIFILLNA